MEKCYVVCTDKVWKDKMVCVCTSMSEAEMVESKWKSFPDRQRVRIVKNEPRYQATWYKVSDQGTVIRL